MKILIGILVLIGIVLGGYSLYTKGTTAVSSPEGIVEQNTAQGFARYDLATDTTKSSIDLTKILSGGPGKDGIPAIVDPQFISIAEADIADDVQGIYLSINGDERYYPYTILVWHEIVNDIVGGTPVAVTFCPLCGSAIVFERTIDAEVHTFGVSGLLFESNLVMYDQSTESLWSQARGEAVVGTLTGTSLRIVPMQLLSFGELQRTHPQAQVLSTDTGFRRDYSFYPYGNYTETDALYFPVSVSDERFFAKEIMYVIPFGDTSIALEQQRLATGEAVTFTLDDTTLTAQRSGESLEVTTPQGTVVPGYYEMWFSWATHHQENGVVWAIE